MQTIRMTAVLAALALAAPLSAQHGAHAASGAPAGDHHEGPPPYMTAIANDLEMAEQKLVALAEAIPAAQWNWRPAEGVRSIGEVYMHIAADNYFIPAMTGAAAPAETGIRGDDFSTAVAYESRPLGQAEAIAAMRASFDHLQEAIAAVDHDDLHAEHSFFGNQMTGMQIWLLTATHLHEHLGQSIAYARSVGVAPPWSRGQ